MTAIAPPPDEISTEITAVTVYSRQALITRTGTVQVSSGTAHLSLPGLPIFLEPESVRVTGKGNVPVQLLGVATERRLSAQPTDQAIAHLQDQLTALQDQRQDLQIQFRTASLQRTWIQTLADTSAPRLSRSIADQNVPLDQAQALLEFVGQHYTNYTTTRTHIARQVRSLDQQITALERQIQQQKTPKLTESYTITVAIASEQEGNMQLEVSYMVNRVGWTPLYDLAVFSDHLSLQYLANITQRSREDWTNVALTLSTAKPSLGTLPPSLHPWYVDVPRNSSSPARARVPGKKAALSNEVNNFSLPASSSLDLDEFDEFDELDKFDDSVHVETLAAGSAPAIDAAPPVTDVSQDGQVIQFTVAGDSTIPSDGSPHTVALVNKDYPIRLTYIAMPKLVGFAYLRAEVVNPMEGVTLLPGKVNLFRDRTFVGVTRIPNVAPGQTFTVDLGIDERIHIKRELSDRQVDKTLIGNQRRTAIAFRITVENLLDTEANIRVLEQIPVARNEKIKVKLTQATPKPELGDLGQLQWQLNLAPGSTETLVYQFTLEHPADLRVIGLDI